MRSTLIAVFLCVFTASASAQLIVDKLWMDFDQTSAGRQDVLMKNESERRYYVSVEASEIVDPGLPSEQRVALEDPEELGLLISPNRLILDPENVRALRIVSINPDVETDRVYRVRVTPEVGKITAENAQGEERGINLVMLTAYDILVVVRPQGGEPELSARRTPEELILRNDGTTNTLLVDGQACFEGEDGNETCERLNDVRLYAGAEVRFPLPKPGAEVRLSARDRSYSDVRSLVF